MDTHQYVNQIAMNVHIFIIGTWRIFFSFNFSEFLVLKVSGQKSLVFYMQDKIYSVFYRNFIKEGNLLATLFDEQYFLNSFNIVIMRTVIPE